MSATAGVTTTRAEREYHRAMHKLYKHCRKVVAEELDSPTPAFLRSYFAEEVRVKGWEKP